MDDTEMKVVPLSEVKALTDGLKADVANLREQMQADKEATGLAIEKRSDDLVKAINAVEDFSRRIEDIDRKVQQNAFVGSFGQTSTELKDALESFQEGFRAFNDDHEAREFAVGTKPNLKHIIEGVFTGSSDEATQFHAPRHAAILRLQKAADDVYVVDALMRSQMDPAQMQEYNSRGGARSLKTFRRFAQVATLFQKAAADLIDTATEVANWVPTQYSAQLYEQIKIGLPLVNMFPEVAMAAPTVVLPLDMNDNEATRVTEATTFALGTADPYGDLVTVNPAALSSGKITLTAEKLRSRYWVSQEATEDAIVAMLPFLARKHQRNMGEALEDAILNGQVTGNLDTAGTHFGKANPSAATDARDCWDGLRYFASTYAGSPATSADMGNGKPTVVGVRGIRAAMGEYAINPSMISYIFGMFGYVKLLDDTSVMTLDKMGPQATVRTGVLAQVDGCDVVVSRRMPQNANASGIIDNAVTNRTLAVVVNTEGAILGNRRRITLGQQYHLNSDSTEIVAFWRGDFQPVYAAASVPFVGTLYNIAAA